MKLNCCFDMIHVLLLIFYFFCPPDDLASKANIIIDPAEIQATSMDDLDEDEESGAAQVSCFHVFFVCIHFYIIHVPVPPGFLLPDFVTSLGCWDVLGTEVSCKSRFDFLFFFYLRIVDESLKSPSSTWRAEP